MTKSMYILIKFDLPKEELDAAFFEKMNHGYEKRTEICNGETKVIFSYHDFQVKECDSK